MTYQHHVTLNPASTAAVVEWLTNSIVPGLYSGVTQPTIKGLTGLSYQKGYYLVIGYHMRLRVINKNAAPCFVTVNHTNSSIVAFTQSQLETMASDKDGEAKLLGGSGSGQGSILDFSRKQSCASLVGRAAYFTDDQYGGSFGVLLTPTAPSDNTHMTLGISSTSGNVDVTFHLDMQLTVQVSNRPAQTG